MPLNSRTVQNTVSGHSAQTVCFARRLLRWPRLSFRAKASSVLPFPRTGRNARGTGSTKCRLQGYERPWFTPGAIEKLWRRLVGDVSIGTDILSDVTSLFHGAHHGDCCHVCAQFDTRIFGKKLFAIKLRNNPCFWAREERTITSTRWYPGKSRARSQRVTFPSLKNSVVLASIEVSAPIEDQSILTMRAWKG